MSSRTYKGKRPPEADKPLRLPVIERPRHNPSQPFQDALLNEIRAMCAAVEQKGLAPTQIMAVELGRMVKDALNALYKRGFLAVGDTLNDRWIQPTQTDGDTSR